MLNALASVLALAIIFACSLAVAALFLWAVNTIVGFTLVSITFETATAGAICLWVLKARFPR